MVEQLIVIIEADGFYSLDWINTKSEADQFNKDLFARYKTDAITALLYLGFQTEDIVWSESLLLLSKFSNHFIQVLLKSDGLEDLREKIVVAPDNEFFENFIDTAPFLYGAEYLSVSWCNKLWGALNSCYANQIQQFKGTVSDYFVSNNPSLHLPGRIYFHLVENKTGNEPFAFLATYTSHNSKQKQYNHLPLKTALDEYGSDTKKMLELLITVKHASEKSALISELLNSGEIFHPLQFSSSEAHTFLTEIALYEESGIICRIPDWWRKKPNSFGVKVNVGDKKKKYLSQDTLLSFNAAIFIGSNEMSIREIKKLLTEAEGLSLIKNKWVEVNHQKLNEMLKLYKKAESLYNDKGITLAEAMRLQLNEGKLHTAKFDGDEVEVDNGTWLREVMAHLNRPESLPPINAGKNFTAKLREYQLKGLNWLHYLNTLGLGACLADDMGLGKTIQVIAHLNYLLTKGKTLPTLIVIPASLIGNWVNEISRFAPGLSYFIIHPSDKIGATIDLDFVKKNKAVYITTYALISRYAWISEIEWDYLILDEAQAIKNAHTKQTKAVKGLSAVHRLALTGTPVENSLSDLWSIFDFINPGLLGSIKEFTQFSKNLSNNPDGYKRLKKIISPFILRRLKTDQTIISDLPKKIEMKSYAALSKKQIVFYESLVQSLKNSLQQSEGGIKRKGIILASLIKFKQICNHPDQYSGLKEYRENESGKFERLREICTTIKEKRERVLIFTQFKEITAYLADFLEDVFSHKGLVLHGGVAVKKRRDLVDTFQGHDYVPFMVLSIKAGGTGLNLTAANHVIHFDRWWNPAVENQATDRVFRIGQKKNVIVHKFITTGTIEEKIDQMIEDKSKLVRDILPEKQENWLSEMSDSEILNLIQLN